MVTAAANRLHLHSLISCRCNSGISTLRTLKTIFANHDDHHLAHERAPLFDALTANVMVADTDLKIIYMNEAVTGLLKEAESAIRKDLPSFDVAGLIGRNIDIFDKNPAHRHDVRDTLARTHRATINVGGRVFDLVATPVKEKDGKRTAISVEWSDATLRLQSLESMAKVRAISRSQAVIEFGMDGTVLTANEGFLHALGYTLGEIQGKHHSIFIDPSERDGERDD